MRLWDLDHRYNTSTSTQESLGGEYWQSRCNIAKSRLPPRRVSVEESERGRRQGESSQDDDIGLVDDATEESIGNVNL